MTTREMIVKIPEPVQDLFGRAGDVVCNPGCPFFSSYRDGTICRAWAHRRLANGKSQPGRGCPWCVEKEICGMSDEQMKTNFDYVMGAIESIHETLCPKAKLTNWQGRVMQAEDAAKRLQCALVLIRDSGGITIDEGMVCNGAWCTEQARRALLLMGRRAEG